MVDEILSSSGSQYADGNTCYALEYLRRQFALIVMCELAWRSDDEYASARDTLCKNIILSYAHDVDRFFLDLKRYGQCSSCSPKGYFNSIVQELRKTEVYKDGKQLKIYDKAANIRKRNKEPLFLTITPSQIESKRQHYKTMKLEIVPKDKQDHDIPSDVYYFDVGRWIIQADHDQAKLLCGMYDGR